jgi:protein TonB
MALMEARMTTANSRGLWLAIGVSLLLHALVLSLHFSFPDASRALQAKALDIILVNARSLNRPTEAQALAQVNLDGGGNSEEDRRAKTLLPPSMREQAGNDLEQAQKRVQELEVRHKNLLTQVKNSGQTLRPAETRPQFQQTLPDPSILNGQDLLDSAQQMTQLQAEIDRQTDEYNKRPRGKYFGVRAEEYAGAAYFDSWARKVERIGTLNFPAEAKGKIYGKVTLWIELWRDGDLRKLEIRRSSGSRVLDEASLRIVRMGAPYSEIPKAMLGDGYVFIGFARTLLFTNNNQMTSRADD